MGYVDVAEVRSRSAVRVDDTTIRSSWLAACRSPCRSIVEGRQSRSRDEGEATKLEVLDCKTREGLGWFARRGREIRVIYF